jgi:gamma-glutamylcyclotransferase (GGCT)/AIG2-like uncharacterized protein YtfP
MAKTGSARSAQNEFGEATAGMFKVFVYGTLKPGEANYDRYCRNQVVAVEAAIARGQLYDLPCGYPALTPGRDAVYGFLLWFTDPNTLILLDELEGYCPNRPIEQNEYLRVSAKVYSPKRQTWEQAWIYQMEMQRVHKLGGTHLPSGEWTGQTRPSASG